MSHSDSALSVYLSHSFFILFPLYHSCIYFYTSETKLISHQGFCSLEGKLNYSEIVQECYKFSLELVDP